VTVLLVLCRHFADIFCLNQPRLEELIEALSSRLPRVYSEYFDINYPENPIAACLSENEWLE